MRLRRLRGALLRLMLRRRASAALGAALAAAGAWPALVDRPWETATTDGVSLLLIATGMALVAAAVTGRRPDWYD